MTLSNSSPDAELLAAARQAIAINAQMEALPDADPEVIALLRDGRDAALENVTVTPAQTVEGGAAKAAAYRAVAYSADPWQAIALGMSLVDDVLPPPAAPSPAPVHMPFGGP